MRSFGLMLVTILALLTVHSSFAVTPPSQVILKNQYGEVSLNNITYETETVAAAGALSLSKSESIVNNGTSGSYAVTLAAPNGIDGQFKMIRLGTATHTVTLAMTNIKAGGFYTPSGTTTLTFTAVGDCALLVAVGAKWILIGGSAVAS